MTTAALPEVLDPAAAQSNAELHEEKRRRIDALRKQAERLGVTGERVSLRKQRLLLREKRSIFEGER